MKVKSVLYRKEKVVNKNKKFGADASYYPLYIVTKSGKVVPALFTKEQLEVAMARAEKNPEDVDERASWLERIFGVVDGEN